MPLRMTDVHTAAIGNNMGAKKTGDIYTLRPAATASPRVDDISMPGMQSSIFSGRLHEKTLLTSLIAESWAPKRLQRTPSDTEISLPRPDLSPLTKGIESRSRRQPTRDQKGPESTGPVQTSPYKPYASICVLSYR